MRRRHRLSGARRFQAVRARRISETCRGLRIQAAVSGRAEGRVGFAVPRGVGGAVERNRLRRRLRAIVDERLGTIAGVDLIVAVSSPGVAGATFADLRAETARCLDLVLARARRTDAQ